MTSPLWLAVGPKSVYGGLHFIYKFLDVCPFDFMAVAVSGKVGYPETGLTTQIAWMFSVTTAIDRPKAVSQLLCNRICISIFHSKFFS